MAFKNPLLMGNGFGGVIAGVVVASVALLYWPGSFVSQTTAKKMAYDSGSAAVAQVLAPGCVASFKAAGDDLKAFQDKSSWSRDSYLTEKKYAPDSNVAGACTVELMKLTPAAAATGTPAKTGG